MFKNNLKGVNFGILEDLMKVVVINWPILIVVPENLYETFFGLKGESL